MNTTDAKAPVCTVGHLLEVLQRLVQEGVSPDAAIRLITLDGEFGIGLIEGRPDGQEVWLHSDEEIWLPSAEEG